MVRWSVFVLGKGEREGERGDVARLASKESAWVKGPDAWSS